MAEDFKFPDEKEPVQVEEEAGEIEIVVEDEKPKYSKLREEPGPLDDDEVKQYGEKVRNRIDHLYKGYQTEKRRADRKGDGNIVIDGKTYNLKLSGWERTSQSGKQYLSGKIELAQESQELQPKKEDLPF